MIHLNSLFWKYYFTQCNVIPKHRFIFVKFLTLLFLLKMDSSPDLIQ